MDRIPVFDMEKVQALPEDLGLFIRLDSEALAQMEAAHAGRQLVFCGLLRGTVVHGGMEITQNVEELMCVMNYNAWHRQQRSARRCEPLPYALRLAGSPLISH